MSRELRILVVALVGVVVLFFAISAILPQRWQVESSVQMPAPASRVRPLLGDFAAWQRWATLEGTVRSDTQVRVEGAPDTVGHQIVWQAQNRQARLLLTRVADDGVEYDFLTQLGDADQQLVMGHGGLTVAADGERCVVRWRDEGRATGFTERWFAWFGAQQEAARKFQEGSLARLRVQLEGK